MNSPLLLLVVLILYANAFIYVFKKHTKYFGFILMILAFILSIIYIYVSGKYNEFVDILKVVTPYPYVPVIFLLLTGIVFLHFYSLIKVLSAYSHRSNAKKSFDLKLNDDYAKYLKVFTISFIVGIVLLYLFVFMQNENVNLLGIMISLLLVATTTETIHAIKFAKIKI